jgi:DNA-binding protein HU-beta
VDDCFKWPKKPQKSTFFVLWGLAGDRFVDNLGPSALPWGVRKTLANKKPKGPLIMATATKTSAPTIPLSKVAAELAEKTGMTKKDATGALDDFVGLVVKHLKKGNKVRITGLGILQVRNRPARMGRNPATGEAIKIKASKKVAFRVAKDLKEAI